jgi:hypothetical protein
MRRRIALLTGAGLVLAGLGCYHVGGKCDPGHPADAAPTPITNPYPYVPAPGVAVAPAPLPAAKDAPAKLPSRN